MELTPPIYQCSNGTPRDIVSLLSLRTQGFGERPEVYGPGGHNGNDWSCTTDTKIYAMHDGVATFAEEKNPDGTYKGYGKYVSILGSGVKTYYAHLNRAGKDGVVKAGDIIGYSNNSGFSSGPHIHVTCKFIDANGNVLDRNNGHDGAVDFSTMLVWRPAYNEGMDKALVRSIVEELYSSWAIRNPDSQEYLAAVDYWTDQIKTPEDLLRLIRQRKADIHKVTSP